MGKKFKYQGGITKILCQKKANWEKKNFNVLFSKGPLNIPVKQEKINVQIISFSGATSFEDQVLSIYSFIYYIGKPSQWTIYSDKSYSESQIKIFQQHFDFVKILPWDTYQIYKENKYLQEYYSKFALAKKLNIIAGHPYTTTTVYVDSDIIFYPGSYFYFKVIQESKGLWYTADTIGNDISNYFSKDRKSIYSLNSGMLVLDNSFYKGHLFDYLENLQGNYGYFSEQSSIEYAMFQHKAQLLDPRQFIVDSSDQFDFGYKYGPSEIAMRHYVGPIRHKLWQKGWNWHFQSSPHLT